MTTFDAIPLNINGSQADLKSDKSFHLSHTFDLDPIGEVCLRFVLRIESAPDGTAVHMNRWHVGATRAGQPFVADVTDYVTLEDNVLLLQVERPGAFGTVWLERIPCEEIT